MPTLRIFLCHSSGDKIVVRELYRRLLSDGFTPWLDEENLLPGQDWKMEIPNAVRTSDVVIVCLSKDSVNKTGYVQKEIRYALDVADEQPEGTIFMVPLKLEECDTPERLKRWQWVNYFDEKGYDRLLQALHIRMDTIAKNSMKQPNTDFGNQRPESEESKDKFQEFQPSIVQTEKALGTKVRNDSYTGINIDQNVGRISKDGKVLGAEIEQMPDDNVSIKQTVGNVDKSGSLVGAKIGKKK